jgi:hypothetical protein
VERRKALAFLIGKHRSEVKDPWDLADRVIESFKGRYPLLPEPDEDEVFALAVELDTGADMDHKRSN